VNEGYHRISRWKIAREVRFEAISSRGCLTTMRLAASVEHEGSVKGRRERGTLPLLNVRRRQPLAITATTTTVITNTVTGDRPTTTIPDSICTRLAQWWSLANLYTMIPAVRFSRGGECYANKFARSYSDYLRWNHYALRKCLASRNFIHIAYIHRHSYRM